MLKSHLTLIYNRKCLAKSLKKQALIVVEAKVCATGWGTRDPIGPVENHEPEG